ncbi:(deoxy)nucleoside triphosphate pyrophosphohydrolase [Gammaproteobacteria bacterium]|nr:(deoxy)nucleoside triphosphate pyrophosphohydrolase [Gammaproteobacteria bacterium]
MSKINLAVAIGLILNNDKILLDKRRSGHYSGYWEFPGGKIEQGENHLTALKRELDEELDIHVTQANEVLAIKHELHTFTLSLHVFFVTTYEREIIPNEQQQLQWAHIKQLRHIKLIPTNEAIIQLLEQKFLLSI